MLDVVSLEARIVQGSGSDDIAPILFGQLRPLIADNVGRKAIKNAFPELKDKNLLRALGLYYAKVAAPEAGRSSIRVLCDENISSKHMRICQRLFGYATHISFENMLSRPDTDVWQYAVDEQFDLILTHDKNNVSGRDLTFIALDCWRQHMLDPALPLDALGTLPQLLHLTGDAREGKNFGKIAAGALCRIFELQAAHDAPVLVLNEAGVRVGVHGFELLIDRSGVKGKPSKTAKREERWARKYLNVLLPDRHAWQNREDPKVRQRKRMVTRAVAIAARGSETLQEKRLSAKQATLVPAA